MNKTWMQRLEPDRGYSIYLEDFTSFWDFSFLGKLQVTPSLLWSVLDNRGRRKFMIYASKNMSSFLQPIQIIVALTQPPWVDLHDF